MCCLLSNATTKRLTNLVEVTKRDDRVILLVTITWLVCMKEEVS